MAETQGWDGVLQSPAYQAMPRDAQLAAKAQYFHEVLAPRVGTDPRALRDAYTRFMDYKPVQLGQGETVRRTGEAGLRQGAAGMLRTLGALREYAGEYPVGEMGLPEEAYQPVYGAGDPLFKEANRQTDLARRALPKPGEKAPFWGQLIGGTTGILAAPFAAQQAATDQLRQGASAGQAIAAATAEIPASAIQLAAPELGGRLGGQFVKQPGLRRLGAKALGGGGADVVAEPLATELRNQGLPEDQRQQPQVTPESVGESAVFGLLARSAKPAAVRVPEGPVGAAGVELHEGEPKAVEPRGLAPEPVDTPAVGTGLQEPSAQAPPPNRTPDPPAGHEAPSAPPSEGRGLLEEPKTSASAAGTPPPQPPSVPQRPSVYSVAYEVKLHPSDYGKSRSVHKRLANGALARDLRLNPELLDIMKSAIPGLESWLNETGGRKTPEGWIWEHASTSTAFGQKGMMRLVPKEQHTPGSAFWRILHPDKGASGGYSEWAIPNGAPRRKTKE